MPGYAAQSIAELVIAFAVSLARRIPQAQKSVRDGHYHWELFEGMELAGRTIGILGTGSIGSRVAVLASSLGMRTHAFTAHPSAERGAALGVDYVDFEQLLSASDLISIHLPLTSATHRLLDRQALQQMKRGSFLINTTRGAIVDQSALVTALQSGHIAGAALDTLDPEPPGVDNPLLLMDNVILTPHYGFHTTEALDRKTAICVSNVENFLDSCPTNVINPNVLGSTASSSSTARQALAPKQPRAI